MVPAHEFARLYDAHAQALFAFLLDFTGCEADARDLLQDLFVRIAQRETLLEHVESERGFLIRMANNLAIDAARRHDARERKHAAFEKEASGATASTAGLDEGTYGAALVEALRTLPQEQRAVVHLKLWGGMTFEEIGSALELSPNTAASRYRYGLDKLRQQLRPLYDEDI